MSSLAVQSLGCKQTRPKRLDVVSQKPVAFGMSDFEGRDRFESLHANRQTSPNTPPVAQSGLKHRARQYRDRLEQVVMTTNSVVVEQAAMLGAILLSKWLGQ